MARDLENKREFQLAGGHIIPTRPFDARTPEELARQVENLHNLYLDHYCGIWEWKPSGDSVVTGEFWDQFGAADSVLEQLLCGDSPALVHHEDLSAVQAAWSALVGKQRRMDLTARAFDREGNLCWVRMWGRCALESGEKVFAGGCEDVTPQAAEQNYWRLQAEKISSAITAVGDGLWEWDIPSGRLIWSVGCFEALGYTGENMPEQPDAEFLRQHLDAEQFARIEQAVQDNAQNKRPFVVEFQVRHLSGRLLWYRARAHLRLDENGQPERITGTTQDITSTRQSQLLRQSERESRLAHTQATLLSSLGHELKTPLNAILGYSQLFDHDQKLTPEQREQIFEIRRAGKHLLHLVDDVMDLARIDVEELATAVTAVNPAQLIRESAALLVPLAEARKVTLEFDEAEWRQAYVGADPVRLKQIVVNLVGNAVKYNVPGGRVAISLSLQAKRVLRLSVMDTGIGIPTELRDKVFEPFNRLGAEAGDVEGTGIGLAITRRLTEGMGGSIDFESHPGQGSVFWVDFPLVDAPPETAARAPGVERVVRLPACRLLYVDDKPANARLLERLFRRFPQAELECVSDAVEALFVARTRPPDVLLLDTSAPGMSTESLLEILNADECTRGIPVVALGALAQQHDGQFAAQLGRPIEMPLLVSVLARCLAPAASPATVVAAEEESVV
ncbi:hybrid sensor histidine kinase/response regulator [Biformimicrobium ophioploci]|uniref:histidine kinase n=1 Tax=Biformimicrobium ophioploci TaxID=3036711 RepID=A0ABQ6LZB4_9GAMM|nr:ATP-binding protein [Microbulbifer sp. NKW57]GMG87382.1 hypothetical protein MNKW57_17030 [Microbulbifer sp. NKW57]